MKHFAGCLKEKRETWKSKRKERKAVKVKWKNEVSFRKKEAEAKKQSAMWWESQDKGMNGWVYLSPTLPAAQFFAASIASTLIVPCNVLFLLYHGYLFFSLYRKIILLYFCVVCFCFEKFFFLSFGDGSIRDISCGWENLFYFLSIDDGSHRDLLFVGTRAGVVSH